MLRQSLEQISHEHLERLCRDHVPESIRLEFKRELSLDDEKQKAEAAKDVSSMANTAGGRILYGIEEVVLLDGSRGAGPIRPLRDGTIDTRLENVLLSTIHPRPRFRLRKVSVTDSEGFVLIVEVYPAYSSDLHMVTGFKEHRFYRRSENRAVLMEEPEIREAYARIAASRQALDAWMEGEIRSEVQFLARADESVLVVPWFPNDDLLSPRRFGENLGSTLINGPLEGSSWCFVATTLAIVSDGYLACLPTRTHRRDCERYFHLRRNGLVHLAQQVSRTQSESSLEVELRDTVAMTLATLLTASYLFDEAGYWGPVRVIHELRMRAPFAIRGPGICAKEERLSGKQLIEPSNYRQVVAQVNLKEQGKGFNLVVRELLDQVFQINGHPSCPWFDESGKVKGDVMRVLGLNCTSGLWE